MKILLKKDGRKLFDKAKILFIIFIILNIFFIYKHQKLFHRSLERNNISFHNSILKSENISDKINTTIKEELTTTILIKGKNFIDRCFSEQNRPKFYNINVKPIISAIIPVYNANKTIIASVSSIQNQNFNNFEIILVDDFSNDNTSQIIKIIQEKDSRIKIIRNKKNMGSLYSRSIGVLLSKGEYIFGLDNDDLFFVDDIFDFILRIAKKYNYDIVGFRAIKIDNYTSSIKKMRDLYNYKSYNNINIHQPQLGTWLITKNGEFSVHDVTIWAKCISAKVYKDATKRLGAKRYSIFVSWGEDTIVNFINFNIAQSFAFVHKYGIIHLVSSKTASFSKPASFRLLGEIFILDIIYDFSRNNTDKNYAVIAAYNVKNRFKINKFINNTNLVYFKSVLTKILNCQYITLENKNKIKNDFRYFFI